MLKHLKRPEIPRELAGDTCLSHSHTRREKNTSLAAWQVLGTQSQDQARMRYASGHLDPKSGDSQVGLRLSENAADFTEHKGHEESLLGKVRSQNPQF